MNASLDMTQLQQLIWSLNQDSAQREQILSGISSMFGEVARAFLLAVALGALLIALVALCYHPRIPRGGLWVPLFGLFGATPRFYTHTRPASFFGFFLKSRHRVTNHRRRKPAERA